MLVIRRMVDRHRAYTVLMLPGERPRIFPTSDQEHARVLQIYKQDRAHEGIHNDFSDYAIGLDSFTANANQAIPSNDEKARRDNDGRFPS